MTQTRLKSEQIEAYQQWLADWLAAGYEVYFVTFQFFQLGGGERNLLAQMKKELDRFYRILITNVCRHARRAASDGCRPEMVAAPDRPVCKRSGRFRIDKVRPNDGIHWHALIAIPPASRLQEPLNLHIAGNERRYLGWERSLRNIHCVQVSDATGRLADYELKHIKRGTFDTDSILIFPRSRSELESS
jgi:hypothetical protein